MSEGTIFITEKVCPQCGRNFTVLYPGEWAYKRGRVGHIIYLCSWKCLRAWDGGDTKKEELEVEKDTKKHDRKATLTHMIEMYEAGKTKTEVLRYLKDEGYKVPEQTHADLKAYAKIKLPELYARLLVNDMPAKVETPETITIGKYIELPKIDPAPAMCSGMTVREVEGNFARYRRSDVGGSTYIDVEIEDSSDTLSYTIEQWRSFRKEHDRAAVILGVEM
jgi:hypothetical protein